MYQKPIAIKVHFTYDIAFGRKCHFADYKECSTGEQQFK